MKVTILKLPRAWPARGGAIEIASCPALTHKHTWRSFKRDGCRCPSTLAALEEKRLQHRDATRRYRAGLPVEENRLIMPRGPRPNREIDDCPAERHRHSYEGYLKDGCRCPSTLKAYARRQETQRAALERHRERANAKRRTSQFDLRRADRIDAEHLAQGYHLRAQVSKHTRALAVQMMIQANPRITDRQIGWRLANAGQVGHNGKPLSMRQVQRIVATLKQKGQRVGKPLVRVIDGVDDDVDQLVTV